MIWPRIIERVRARITGYFWHECPMCLRWYSGREWAKRNFPCYGWRAVPTNNDGYHRWKGDAFCGRCHEPMDCPQWTPDEGMTIHYSAGMLRALGKLK